MRKFKILSVLGLSMLLLVGCSSGTEGKKNVEQSNSESVVIENLSAISLKDDLVAYVGDNKELTYLAFGKFIKGSEYVVTLYNEELKEVSIDTAKTAYVEGSSFLEGKFTTRNDLERGTYTIQIQDFNGNEIHFEEPLQIRIQ